MWMIGERFSIDLVEGIKSNSSLQGVKRKDKVVLVNHSYIIIFHYNLQQRILFHYSTQV